MNGKNVFIGDYVEVLRAFDESLSVDLIIVRENRYSDEIEQYSKENSIPLVKVEDKYDLERNIVGLEDVQYIVVASFTYILTDATIQKSKKVINFHPGSLKTCRGRHPLPFAIKKGLEVMSISVHEIINEKIDNGPLLLELNLPIDYTKDYDYNYSFLRSFLYGVSLPLFQKLRVEGELPSVEVKVGEYNEKLSREELEDILNTKELIKYQC